MNQDNPQPAIAGQADASKPPAVANRFAVEAHLGRPGVVTVQRPPAAYARLDGEAAVEFAAQLVAASGMREQFDAMLAAILGPGREVPR
jgi:hypothetical protein